MDESAPAGCVTSVPTGVAPPVSPSVQGLATRLLVPTLQPGRGRMGTRRRAAAETWGRSSARTIKLAVGLASRTARERRGMADSDRWWMDGIGGGGERLGRGIPRQVRDVQGEMPPHLGVKVAKSDVGGEMLEHLGLNFPQTATQWQMCAHLGVNFPLAEVQGQMLANLGLIFRGGRSREDACTSLAERPLEPSAPASAPRRSRPARRHPPTGPGAQAGSRPTGSGWRRKRHERSELALDAGEHRGPPPSGGRSMGGHGRWSAQEDVPRGNAGES